MCTVSFIALADGFVITSNRDEQRVRAAMLPVEEVLENNSIFYPKDPKSGGTWFVSRNDGTVLVLLNGADEKHNPSPPYTRSRGLVVLEMISNGDPQQFWNRIHLANVEPFTMVLFQGQSLVQLRWNGAERSLQKLALEQRHFWSSVTLYDAAMRKNREQWFKDFLDSNKEITPDKIFSFHENTHTENRDHGLVIDRKNNLKTLSITQTVVRNKNMTMVYKDLISGEIATTAIQLL